jgi:hypothetical protein
METKSYGKRKPKRSTFAPYENKFVVCPFVDKETNRSYPFANVLND